MYTQKRPPKKTTNKIFLSWHEGRRRRCSSKKRVKRDVYIPKNDHKKNQQTRSSFVTKQQTKSSFHDTKGDGGAAVRKKICKRDLYISKKDHKRNQQTKSFFHDAKGDGGAAAEKQVSKEIYAHQKEINKRDLKPLFPARWRVVAVLQLPTKVWKECVYIKKRPTKKTYSLFPGEVKGDGGAAVQRSVSNTSYAYQKRPTKETCKNQKRPTKKKPM